MKKLIFTVILISMSFGGSAQLQEVNSGVYKWSELSKKESHLKVGRKIMEGTSPHFEYLEIHATTQEKGAKPNPPHTQEHKEELIIIKEGLMKMTLNGKSKILGTGSIIAIPPGVEQSMENIGDGPMTYYVMIYKTKNHNLANKVVTRDYQMLDFKDLKFETTSKGGRIHYFNRPTTLCDKFEMHVTQLNQKGPSHKPHAHVDSEIILVIEGETEMLINGKTYEGSAGDLYFMKSNELHGISNIGPQPCKYFAFRWIGNQE